MKEIVFTRQFRGRGQAVEGTPDLRRARTTAAFEGDTATTDAEVRLTGPRSFTETGRIRYGAAGAITFRTIGEGVRAGRAPLHSVAPRAPDCFLVAMRRCWGPFWRTS